MLWQIAYSEFYISPVYWPDFDVKELDKAIIVYGERLKLHSPEVQGIFLAVL
jgi:undecaprenyl diphosphate synthase